MAEHHCRGCGAIIRDGEPCHFVKIKGQRGLRWYCQKCVKGEGKHDTDGKRH